MPYKFTVKYRTVKKEKPVACIFKQLLSLSKSVSVKLVLSLQAYQSGFTKYSFILL